MRANQELSGGVWLLVGVVIAGAALASLFKTTYRRIAYETLQDEEATAPRDRMLEHALGSDFERHTSVSIY